MKFYLTALTDFIAMHPQYAYVAVFLLALSEAVPIVGTVVPGSTLIFGISALATAADLQPWMLLVAATIGAIVGDGLSFWLGRRYHRDILLQWPLNQFPAFISRGEAFFNRYGGASVFLARFTAVVRAFVPLIAGILGMPARQFYIANVLSAVIWAPAHVFPGVMVSVLAKLAGATTDQIIMLVIAAIIAAGLLIGLIRARAARRLPRPPG
jgi:membrane protein DedA with SNARE-associated domain